MTLKISADSGVLYVEAAGTFSLSEAKRTFLEILDAAGAFQATKILVDGGKFKANP